MTQFSDILLCTLLDLMTQVNEDKTFYLSFNILENKWKFHCFFLVWKSTFPPKPIQEIHFSKKVTHGDGDPCPMWHATDRWGVLSGVYNALVLSRVKSCEDVVNYQLALAAAATWWWRISFCVTVRTYYATWRTTLSFIMSRRGQIIGRLNATQTGPSWTHEADKSWKGAGCLGASLYSYIFEFLYRENELFMRMLIVTIFEIVIIVSLGVCRTIINCTTFRKLFL